MTPSARILLTTVLLAATQIHAQQISDPANLTGEHIAPQALADTLPINHGTPALQQQLLKLRTRASLMLIVAHPDDEDGGLLTYESRGLGARVAMLTLTRGEGGQNLMSADFNDALGLIRTQELLAADRYMGVDQFFGTEADFGFSKTKEEAFAKWTHDRVLYDAVRAVRLYRPLVLASVFVGGPTDGHGHHQVAGEITQEVFLAAADPKLFPEMGLPPWAPLKVYARVPFFRVTPEGMYDYATGKYAPTVFHNYVTGADIDHEPAATVTIHESQPSDRLGMNGDTYVQFARKGLALQKSQNGGLGRGGPGGGGTVDVGYTLIAQRISSDPQNSSSPEQSLFDGIDTSLLALAGLAPDAPLPLHQSLVQTLPELDRLFTTAAASVPNHLDAAAEPLRIALTDLNKLLNETQNTAFEPTQKFNLLHELRLKRTQLVRALTLALGVTVDSVVTSPKPSSLTPGHPFLIRSTLTTSSPAPLTLLSANLHIASAAGYASPATIPAQPIADPTLLSASAPLTLTFEDRLPANTPVTRPVFSRSSIEQPFYTIANPALRNAPAAPDPLIVDLTLRDATGAVLEIESAVRLEQDQPAATPQIAYVVPAISVSLAPSHGIVATAENAIHLTSLVKGESSDQLGNGPMIFLKTDDKSYGQILKNVVSQELGPTGERALTIPASEINPKDFTLQAVVTAYHHDYTEAFRPVGYPGLTYTNYYTPATYQATAVNVVTAPNLHIAYLPGTGDDVPAFLPNLGITPTLITPADLNSATLSKFDAILLGVRAYAAIPSLAGSGSQPLIDFAKQGGIVILQYMTARYGDPEAPYPISVPGDPSHNVVEEDQPVQILAPNAPILNWPNKITSADFDHWVEERGHGFAASWAPQYTPLLETHDPGQDPQKGGLLIAPVGKGAYLYCAFALYRQLPEGVPGAYRLIANLLSYPKNPTR